LLLFKVFRDIMNNGDKGMGRKFKSFISKYFKNEDGSIIPMTALLMPLLLGMTGFGVDVSMWMMNKRSLQSAADAAAIAAALEIANGYADSEAGVDVGVTYDTYPEYAAIREAIRNGYDPDRGDITITINDELTEVNVTIAQEQDSYFSALVFEDNAVNVVNAAATLVASADDFCLLALDDSASGAVTTAGNVTIDAQGCGIAVNSTADDALELTGSVVIDIGDITTRGDMEITGNGVELDYASLTTGSSTVPDPYEDLDVPEYSGCDETNYSTVTDATLSPGVYCGGITIGSSSTVELEPGVYIMDCGDFDVTGSGTLLMEGVSVVLTCSTADDYGNIGITGSRDVSISAPAPGEDMEGVAIYRDRNAPESNGQCGNVITGTAGIMLDGAAYLPTDCFRVGGDASALSPTQNPCTRIIAQTIEFHGNPGIANNCEGSAANDISPLNGVRLSL
jgi:Flp pilus assembly protein TadG